MTDPKRPLIRRTRAQERIDAVDTSPSAVAAALEKLRHDADAKAAQAQAEHDEALAKLATERDEYLAGLQRERAEFTNFRQRTAKEREQERGLAGIDLISKVLALADDFDRAIDTRPADLADNAWAEGIAAIDRKLRSLLESEGVTAVEASSGTAFDPREHEAIASIPGTGLPDGVIVEEVRRGYRLRDRLIRPALVAVAQGGDAPPAPRPN
ncbi:MAG: nucleotide exchange factor GrpE [Candidatus Limnocylindrales bacterium]